MDCVEPGCTKRALSGQRCGLHDAMAFRGRGSFEIGADRVSPAKPKPKPKKINPEPEPEVKHKAEPKRVCGYVGCEKVVFRQQLCRGHFCQLHPELAPKPTKSKSCRQTSVRAPCSVENCEQPSDAKGLCKRHYARLKRNGDPIAPPPKRHADTCSIEGCDDDYWAKNCCHRHYNLAYRAAAEPMVCAWAGCDALARQKNTLCPKHIELKLTNDPDRPRCAEDGCDQAARKRGLCGSHYRLMRRNDPNLPRCSVEGCDRAAYSATTGKCENHVAVDRRAAKAAQAGRSSLKQPKQLAQLKGLKDDG